MSSGPSHTPIARGIRPSRPTFGGEFRLTDAVCATTLEEGMKIGFSHIQGMSSLARTMSNSLLMCRRPRGVENLELVADVIKVAPELKKLLTALARVCAVSRLDPKHNEIEQHCKDVWGNYSKVLAGEHMHEGDRKIQTDLDKLLKDTFKKAAELYYGIFRDEEGAKGYRLLKQVGERVEAFEDLIVVVIRDTDKLRGHIHDALRPSS